MHPAFTPKVLIQKSSSSACLKGITLESCGPTVLKSRSCSWETPVPLDLDPA